MNVLSASNLVIKRIDRTIENITFDIKEDDSIILYSLNMDASVILNSLYDVRQIESGNLKYFDDDLLTYSPDDISNLHSRDFAYLSSKSSLLDEFSLIENIKLVGNMNEEREDEEFLESLLELSNLKDRKDVLPSELSIVEKKKAMIIRSIIKKPYLVFIDSFTKGMDEQDKKKVMTFINRINGIHKIPFVHATSDSSLLSFGSIRIIIDKEGMVIGRE